MKIRNLFLIPLILFLVSCSTTTHYRNDRSGANFNSDDYECELVARRNTIPQQFGIAFDDLRYNSEKNSLWSSCIRAKGWYEVAK